MKYLIVVAVAIVGLAGFTTAPAPAAAASAEGLRVVESNAQHIVLELRTPSPALTERSINGATYLDLSVPAWDNTSEPGKPSVPILGTMVAIPQGAQVSLNVLRDKTSQQSLAHPLSPVPTLHADYSSNVTTPDPVIALVPDSAAYNSAENYPANLATVSEPAQWRSQRYVTLQFAPLQYNAAQQQLTIHERVRVEIQFNLPAGLAAAALGTSVDEGAFEPILSSGFLNYDEARQWRTRSPAAVNPIPAANAAAATASYKIAVNSDGIYKLVCADLQNAGMDTASLALDKLQVSNRGTEVAILVLDDNANNRCDTGDQILFWGESAGTNSTDTNIYWLTVGTTPGKRMNVRPGTGSGTPSSSFRDNIHLEENDFFIGYLPWDENAEHWWWVSVPNQYDPDGNGAANSADFTFQLPAPLTAGSANLRVMLGAVSATNHHTQILVNGTQVYDQTWAGVTTLEANINVAAALLHAGSNVVRVQEVLGAPNYIWINTLDLDYPSAYLAQNNALRFRQPTAGKWSYSISGFSGAALRVFDITDPLNPAFIEDVTNPVGESYTTQFTDTAASPRTYYALNNSERQAPLSVRADTPSNLRNASNGADYIIITHSKFKSNIQPLADYRATQMRVAVVDIEDVYDEFNDGIMDAQAIRDFLAYAYANWQPPKPSYVLLVGDGNLNLKNNAAYPIETNFIPPYMKLVDPWIGMTASDHRLVTLDGNSRLPSMAIGRLPALSKADVDGMVSKILSYEQAPPGGAWRNSVLFAADDPDSAGNFYALSNLIADNPYYMPSPLVGDKVYYPSGGQSAIVSAINAGRLIVNYVGHSAIGAWSQNLLANTNAATLTNGARLPLMLPMTCYDGYFHFPGLASVSEAMVVQAGGGAIASWAPTGLGVATRHDVLDRGFFEALFEKNTPRIGAAALFAKTKLNAEGGGQDLLDTFNLLGDPATKLAVRGSFLTPVPTATATATATTTPTATRTATRTNTPKPTATFTPTKTPTRTNTPTRTPTRTNTPTRTLTRTNTPVRTNTPTRTLTRTATSAVKTATRTPTRTTTVAAKTATRTPTNTAVAPTATKTLTRTPTRTPTRTVTALALSCGSKPARPIPLEPADQAKTKKQKARLVWEYDPCAATYRLQVRRDDSHGESVVRENELAGTEYRTARLETEAYYVWRVRACNELGCGKWTKWQQFYLKQKK